MKVMVFPNQVRGNPYFQNFVAGLRAAGIEDVRLSNVLKFRTKFDAIHLHHPEHVVTLGSWLESVILCAALLSVAIYARLTGRPVVWMVHDVQPAFVRRKIFLAFFMKAIKSLISAHVFLNKSSQQAYYAKNPREARKPFCFAPHSRFETVLVDAATVKQHRQTFGIADDDLLVSFLGSITLHKSLETAALIPDQTRSGRTVKLAICGVIDQALPRDYLDNIVSRRPRKNYIRVPDRLTDEALALWIQSSDAVCLSYSLGSNSGMALNVLSNHGRIIASNLPMFKELEERCGRGWIRCVDVRDAAAVAEVVDSLDLWRDEQPDMGLLEPLLTEGDPAENGRRLRDFYDGLRRRTMKAMPERTRPEAVMVTTNIPAVGGAPLEPVTPGVRETALVAQD